MKRILTTAAFGGLLVFLVPQAASASARPVTPYDHSADHKDCAGKAEEANSGKTEEAKEPSERQPDRAGDREQRGDDGGEILF